jgi:hypothetical protein
MDRRSFLKTGVCAAVVGAAGGASGEAADAVANPSPGAATPAILASYTAEDHRRQLENISV